MCMIPDMDEKKKMSKKVQIASMDRELMMIIKLYADGRRIPLYRAIEHLLRVGLSYESKSGLVNLDKTNPYEVRVVRKGITDSNRGGKLKWWSVYYGACSLQAEPASRAQT